MHSEYAALRVCARVRAIRELLSVLSPSQDQVTTYLVDGQ